MSKVSVLIPARNELFLAQTIDDLLKNAAGDIEIIVVLDGWWPQPALKDDPRLIVVHRERQGMREAINGAVAIARGEYIMKVDAHCSFAEGFDETLKTDCDDNWIVIPRRYSLNSDDWRIKPDKPFIDYEYLCHPSTNGGRMHGKRWMERTTQRINIPLDENMTFQGSCWFMTKSHFINCIGRMQSDGYGTFIGEAQELGLTTWLAGGKIMTNKKTWYAHLWKGKPYRAEHLERLGFAYTRIGQTELKSGNAYLVDYWMNQRREDLFRFIEHFWPVPTWSEDRALWAN